MRWVAALLLAMVCLAGGTRPSEAQSSRLEPALLRPADLGPEWSIRQLPEPEAAQPQSEDGSADEDGGALALCGRGVPDIGATAPREWADRWYIRDDERAIVYHAIDQLSLVAGRRFMAYLRSLPLPCAWSSEGVSSGHVLHEMESLPFPSLGDESVAFRLVEQGDGFGYEINMVYVRIGGLVTQVTSFAVDPPSERVDTSHTEALVRLVVKRLASL
jgi:hypothetical protein